MEKFLKIKNIFEIKNGKEMPKKIIKLIMFKKLIKGIVQQGLGMVFSGIKLDHNFFMSFVLKKSCFLIRHEIHFSNPD